MSDNQTPVLVTPKPWYASRTIWFNAILMIVGVVVYVLQGIQTGQLQAPWVIDEATLTFWIGVLNMVLRFVTTQPIATGGK